jgi:eukaryotic-like serine/threonine-protein kinase
MSIVNKLKDFFVSKRFLKNFGILIFIYILVIGGTIFYLSSSTNHGEKIKVPLLIGKNVKNIKQLVESSDLNYEVLDSIFNPDVPEGTVIFQDPKSTDSTGVFVKSGRVVKVRVSKRTKLVEMPHLVHRSQRFAESVLTNRGIKFIVSYEATSESNGAVLNQLYKGKFIKEGTRLPIGSTIQLVVGRNQGGEPVQIPNLQGLTINEVKQRLADLPSVTLYIACQECVTAADSSAVRVFSQSPEFVEGNLSPAGTTVTVTMKKM